jgi:hypothetical protein
MPHCLSLKTLDCLFDVGSPSPWFTVCPPSHVDAEPEPANLSLIVVPTVNSGCLGTAELLRPTCSIGFRPFSHQVQQSLITTVVTDSEKQMVIWSLNV